MTVQKAKERLDYIDIAKAIGITLVVLRHCGISIGVFAMFHMPLFFILSGMFFSERVTFIELLKNKTNRLLLPWGFFYVLGCVLFYIAAAIKPELNDHYFGLIDVFVHRATFNYPIWYLLCLFWFFLLYYILSKIPSLFSRSLIVVALSLCGCYLGTFHIFLPCYLDIAISSLLFFHIGCLVFSHTDYLSIKKRAACDLLSMSILIVITLLGYFVINPKIWMANNILDPMCFVFSTTGAFALIFACKLIKKWRWLSYIGRYSIIILCWHNIFQRLLEIGFDSLSINDLFAKWVVLIFTMGLSIIMIPLSLKMIPWFVGKTALIK